jgi:glycosyltransferase involved in cell wall biosynthesis
MNRTTIHKAIKSLDDQTDQDWELRIVWDGDLEKLPHHRILEHPKIGCIWAGRKVGSAGQLRNMAINRTDGTWIGFLDDDDWLKSTYVEHLKLWPTRDLVIFTYVNPETGETHPDPKATDFRSCDVGISFAIRKDFVDKHNLQFFKHQIEDYEFLARCKRAGANYILTHDVQYYVSGRNNWQYF